MPGADHTAIIHAYRHLYRRLLYAVKFSTPSRYVVRDQLRAAFRESSPESFQPERIARTIEFLRYAETASGLEHKILKNLVFVRWGQWRMRGYTNFRLRGADPTLEPTAYDAYEETVQRLNDTMGLCLR